jgi:hypothetical protein
MANNFKNEAPALAQQDVEELQAAKDLKNLLPGMQQKIETFTELQPPETKIKHNKFPNP